MANTVLIRSLIDGPKEAVIHVFLASDGASGDLTDQVVVDVSALNPPPAYCVVKSVHSSFSGFSGILEFDATTDVGFFALPSGFPMKENMECFGGIRDNSGTGKTGDILLTTSGFTASGDVGNLIITITKVF